MLVLDGVNAGYGNVSVLRGVGLTLSRGQVLCLLGRNGAGKTTTLKAILGLLRVTKGTIRYRDVDLTALPAEAIARHGIGYVPQGRRLFGNLNVAENLEIGLMVRDGGRRDRDRILDYFPVLKERLGQRASLLSGGEQQMLAMARALCTGPSLLLMDEPTEGLQPSVISKIRGVIRSLAQDGVSVLLVEQRVDAVLPVADRVMFLENGQSRRTVDVQELKADPDLLHRYVGVS
ncbi:MAG: ABC transporter ATP-binding protein [Alphaproteobacteria bacterium]